jgi:hypothetical protein
LDIDSWLRSLGLGQYEAAESSKSSAIAKFGCSALAGTPAARSSATARAAMSGVCSAGLHSHGHHCPTGRGASP